MTRNKLEQKNTVSEHQRLTLAVVTITSFMTTFSSSSMNLAIPAISMDFNASATLIGWIVTGYILANAVLSVPFGRIADLTSRRVILIIGIFLFSIFGGLCTLSWSITSMIVFRILQGVGSAMIFSTNTAILIQAFPPEKRGKVIGYSIASTYVGLSAGPVLGGLLNHYLGWHSIFIVTFITGSFVFVLALRYLPKDEAGSSDGQFDIIGNILYILMILCIMYGFSTFADSLISKLLIPVGILVGVVFVLHERKAKSPIIEVRMFANNTSYTLSNIAALLNYGATFAVGYFMSIYLQLIMGFDSQVSGLILITQPLIMAILSPYAGRLSDKISPFKLASFGMLLCSMGLFLFIFLSVDYPIWLIVLNLILMGFGFAFFSSPNTNAVMSCVPPRDYSVASSILATMRSMGHASSMAVVTLIVTAQMGTAAFSEVSPELLVRTMRIGFIVFTIVCFAGIFLSLQRKSKNLERDMHKH